MSINTVALMGRLTKDPTKTRAGETNVCHFTVAVDDRNSAGRYSVNPSGNHCGIRTVRVLPQPEHIEVPESGTLKPVNPRVKFGA